MLSLIKSLTNPLSEPWLTWLCDWLDFIGDDNQAKSDDQENQSLDIGEKRYTYSFKESSKARILILVYLLRPLL